MWLIFFIVVFVDIFLHLPQFFHRILLNNKNSVCGMFVAGIRFNDGKLDTNGVVD